ncbi:MAG TPA: tRNA lysidine(34) synthetase TilS [Puia sp.]|nr:tRNA lysidine(34) synthetase TilS [Puia sp.]
MDLLHGFNEFIKKENLFTHQDRLLVAVSGGLDSVVLCEMLHRAGFDFVIAHCNFRLRGEESDRDEQFVIQLAERYGKKVFVKAWDTSVYAAEQKLSIQVAARQLRYDWFREIIEEWGAGVVLTAHHLDDNIETLLMNFFKGTGISGLRGMLPRQGIVVRPLLFTGRAALQQLALDAGLLWVEDSSNESDKYTRNYFRHRIIPGIEEVFPNALQNLAENTGRFREIEMIYRRAVDQQLKKLLEHRGNEVFIPVLKLKLSAPLSTLVYEMITPFGFSAQQTGAVIALLDSGSGKYVVSATHRILRNRDWLIISPLQTMQAANILIEAGDTRVLYEQGQLVLQRLSAADLPAEVVGSSPVRSGAESKRGSSSGSGNTVAWLDAADIRFPLLLRKWRAGDYFYPLGMRKKKKLARFFIDSKLSIGDKEKVWVLEMNKKIVWVVGLRIDDRFRISERTEQVLKIEWLRH